MTPQEFYALVGYVFGYSEEYGGVHTGVDFPWPEGTEIPMFATGRVVAKGRNTIHGNWVSIIVGSVFFHFCHMEDESPLEVGQQVSAGDLVGYVGWTGQVIPASPAGAHLHLAASNEPYPGNGNRVDPLPLIRSYLTSSAGSAGKPIPETPEEEEEPMNDHILLELATADGGHRWGLVSPDLKTFVPIWKVETANALSKRIADGTSSKSGITVVAAAEWNEFAKAAGRTDLSV